MNSAGDCDDRFAARNQLLGFAISWRRILRRTKDARISELSLNLFEVIKALQILGRADGCVDKRCTHRRFTNLFKLHALADRGEFLKVLDDFGPTSELAIVARTKTEHVLRRWNALALSDLGSPVKCRV